jgi:hypothetical protein
MNRVTNYFDSVDQLVSTLGSAEQREEAARLATCPATETNPLDLWLDRDLLLVVAEKAQRQLTALLRKKGLPEDSRASITAARDQRRAFAAWLRKHPTAEVYTRLCPTATFDTEPSRG